MIGFINISVISHLHGNCVLEVLNTLRSHTADGVLGMRVWITLNKPELELERSIRQAQWPFDIRIIKNPIPLGFGANHNQAFTHAEALGSSNWFCVMNPDMLWPTDAQPFSKNLAQDSWPTSVGLICPQQTTLDGALQDFARHVPTPWGLIVRCVRRLLRLPPSGVASAVETADWVNGAFMVWRSSVFAALGGFDMRYFMYCEDTDICLRMRLAGYRMEQGLATVVHLAQRNTSKSWQHLAWHMRSLLRLWLSAAFWRYVWRFKIALKFKSTN